MKVISSLELEENVKTYLNTARTEPILIQGGDENETFILTKQNSLEEDLSRAISMDEAILRVKEGMRRIVDNSKRKKGAIAI